MCVCEYKIESNQIRMNERHFFLLLNIFWRKFPIKYFILLSSWQTMFFLTHIDTINFNAFATGDFEKHIELQQINDAYMRRW